ncbi:MarR family transcriptional regulator, partial [Marseilla massiliensis]|nr:MarR family transcriptional regulator [Marseilla massiliensis]
RKLGLSRSKAKGYAMSSRVRNELVRRERRRAIFGLDPLTRLKVISHRAKVRIRSRLKAKGYITGVHRNILYFTEATCRKARLEAKAARLGLSFQPFPENNTPLSNAI